MIKAWVSTVVDLFRYMVKEATVKVAGFNEQEEAWRALAAVLPELHPQWSGTRRMIDQVLHEQDISRTAGYRLLAHSIAEGEILADVLWDAQLVNSMPTHRKRNPATSREE
jgi:hypothetical protein